MLAPRAVIVHRRTEFEELLARHGTRGQAAFFLRQRDRDIAEIQHRHEAHTRARSRVEAAIPLDWRRGLVERADLDRFVFGPEDVVIAVGQDGLVANVAKYLAGQPVIGVNPEPGRNSGVLVTHASGAIAELLAGGVDFDTQRCTMVGATLDDGQQLFALNEIYIGHPSHQSARYQLELETGAAERQSSSGILVGTGIGSTGWCRSVWLDRRSKIKLPEPDEPRLCWFVREAWPSPSTGTSCTEGALESEQTLTVIAESDLVVFGDGIESDALHVGWGQRITLERAPVQLHLVR